ncbi:MAG: histidine kinase [Gaiellaceae bacterium]
MPLFWRVFAANAALLVAGTLVLVVTPAHVSKHIALTEGAVVAVGLLLMLAANIVLLRPLFKPLERLSRRMQNVDVLRSGQRIPVTSPGEVGDLERTFNEMLERLEHERRESGSRALRAQEAERLRIAQGLHDEVGQAMTGALFQLKRLATELPDRRAEIAEAQDAIRSSLDEVRRIARELRPEMLEHLGLASALIALSSAFSRRTGIAVERRLAGNLPALEPEVELALYRVVQESLTNVARHSEATEVRLALEPGNDSVVLRIVDNGHGFDGAPVEGGGIRGIRERALMVGGALAVKPGASGGVEVRLEVSARRC